VEDKKPKVSVVMPAYNSERYIANAIQSVVAQTMPDWELLVVDDCSEDSTCQIVKGMADIDDRIRLISNEKNLGAAGSRNKALNVATGKYVAFLDSDDLWHPEKLDKQIRCMEETGVGLSYTSYQIINQADSTIIRDYVVVPRLTMNDLLKQNWIGCSTVMLNADVAKKYRFSTDFYHEDLVLWLTMLRDGVRAAGVVDVLMYYSYSVSSRAGNKVNAAKERWNIYRGFMKYSLLQSTYYMLHYARAGIKKYKTGK